MEVVETYYPGITTKRETGKSPRKGKTLHPTDLNLPLNFFFISEGIQKKIHFPIMSFSAFKILNLGNKICNNPLKHVLKTSQQIKHLWCMAKIWGHDKNLNLIFLFSLSASVLYFDPPCIKLLANISLILILRSIPKFTHLYICLIIETATYKWWHSSDSAVWSPPNNYLTSLYGASSKILPWEASLMIKGPPDKQATAFL